MQNRAPYLNLEPRERFCPLAPSLRRQGRLAGERPGGSPERMAWTFGGNRLIVLGLHNRVSWRADGGG
jgi:hypothetical protein